MSDEKNDGKTGVIDVQQIMEMIPHRFPMLLVDRIVEIENGVRVHAIKNVSINEPQFQGHFPAKAIMPGRDDRGGHGAGRRRTRRQRNGRQKRKTSWSISCRSTVAVSAGPVVPGDTMHIHVEVDRNRGSSVWRFKGKAFVDDQAGVGSDLHGNHRR